MPSLEILKEVSSKSITPNSRNTGLDSLYHEFQKLLAIFFLIMVLLDEPRRNVVLVSPIPIVQIADPSRDLYARFGSKLPRYAALRIPPSVAMAYGESAPPSVCYSLN